MVLIPGLSRTVAAQPVSDLTLRIERLSASGNTPAARTLVDSVLSTAREGTESFIEALYWLAVLDSTAAERHYLRVVVEYPLSQRASGALLRLAELELARQARDRASRHLEKLIQEYPHSEHIARARYLGARLALDDGQSEKACALLVAARSSVTPTDVELRNQITYLQSSCAPVAAATVIARDTAAVRDTAVRRDAEPATLARGFAIQVAAYNTQREAATLVRQLQRRGIAARVVGVRAPFRVRVGRYADRNAAQRAMTQAGLRGIIVEAEPS